MLAEGAVHLTTVRLLAPHLTPTTTLAFSSRRAGRERPRWRRSWPGSRLGPMSRLSVRKLPTPRPRSAAAVVPARAGRHRGAPLPISSSPPPRPAATPLSPDRYRIQFTIGTDTLEKLRLAKDLLRHAIPSGDDAAILDRALTALLAELAKKKFAATTIRARRRGRSRITPHPGRGEARGLDARPRTVRLPDEATAAASGRFWSSITSKPYAVGGEPTVSNVQLRCRRHNEYEARCTSGRYEPTRARVRARRTTRSGTGLLTSGQVTSVPEPSTLLMAGLGLALLAGWRARR